MTSLNQIRQTFARHWDLPDQAGKVAWLIKGDFDHFKQTNDLYGPLITDYLLDWTLEAIEAGLRDHQQRWGEEDFLFSVIGDDLTVYLPPSTRAEETIRQMLWSIRGAIEKGFWRRYRVGMLPLPAEFFDDVPCRALEGLRNSLEEMDVVLDFAPRKHGFLLLLPVGPDGLHQPVLDRVFHFLKRRCGKPVPQSDLQLDWAGDSGEPACKTFDSGFIEPPAVSFAACSIRMGEGGIGRFDQPDGFAIYERISEACQSALKICKQQRSGVYLPASNGVLRELQAHPTLLPALAAPLPVRWFSERCLREIFYFKQLDQPVLIQLNPVYTLTTRMPEGSLQKEKYRGNAYGMGLKGINEIFGQQTGDRLIWQLMVTFSDVIRGALSAKGVPPEQVCLAQFVDRFTVCGQQPVFDLFEIVELVRCLAEQFNILSDEIKISHVRASAILSQNPIVGYRLFNQLALTSLSSQPSLWIPSDPPIEVRQNGSFTVFAGSRSLRALAHPIRR